MANYRALRNLSKDGETIAEGALVTLDWLSDQERAFMVQRGHVELVADDAAPGVRLDSLPGWGIHAARLAEGGIVYVHQFLGTDNATLAALAETDEDQIHAWKLGLRGDDGSGETEPDDGQSPETGGEPENEPPSASEEGETEPGAAVTTSTLPVTSKSKSKGGKQAPPEQKE